MRDLWMEMDHGTERDYSEDELEVRGILRNRSEYQSNIHEAYNEHVENDNW